jgi:long-chain fatty acid transport protein
MRNFLVLLTFIFFTIPSISHAGGPIHGGKAAGMGTAFIAVADDPSAILHNAAGLTQSKGTQIYSGVSIIFPKTEYESPSGASEETEFDVFFPPTLYISSDFGMEDIVVGLGIHPTFGIGGRTWPEDGLIRYKSVEGFTATTTINPTIAWQVMQNLSVAAGLDYMYALNNSKVMLDQSLVGAGDAEMMIESDGGGWGYNLGALITLNESFRIGIVYRSEVKIDSSGDLEINDIAPALQPAFGSSDFNTHVSSPFTFPDIYSLGIAYFPDDRLVIAFDVELVRWSTFKQSDLDLDDEVPAAGITDVSMPLDWKDSWQFKTGIDYMVSETLSLRGGYAFINTPAPEHTLCPANPDADSHNFTIGSGYRTGKWTLDFYYMFGYYEDRKVNNNILSGEYENTMHSTGLSIGYRL